MEPRKATVSVLYNGANATAQIAAYINSFTYTDVASGNSDSISLSINDRDKKWIGPWFPVKGDILKPTIKVRNWRGESGTLTFPCGLFHVDDFSFSGGPIRMSLEAIALLSGSDFKSEQRTKTYEQTTLKEIGQKVAARSGLSLHYEGPTIAIAKVEQNNQTDCEFYSSLVVKFGLAVKIYSDRLVVFSEAAYEGKKAKLTLRESDFDPGWTWNTKETGTYTGVKYEYTNSDKNKTFMVTAGKSGRTLKCNEPADNLGEATTLALAALNNANKATTTLSLTMMARPGLIATDCVEIADLGRLSGKYYVEKVTHTIGDAYRMALELRKIEDRIGSAKSAASTVQESAQQSSGDTGGSAPQPAPPPSDTPAEPKVGEQYVLKEKKTGYYTAAEALADKAQDGHPTGKRTPGTYWIFNISQGMLNLTTTKGVPGSWINPG